MNVRCHDVPRCRQVYFAAESEADRREHHFEAEVRAKCACSALAQPPDDVRPRECLVLPALVTHTRTSACLQCTLVARLHRPHSAPSLLTAPVRQVRHLDSRTPPKLRSLGSALYRIAVCGRPPTISLCACVPVPQVIEGLPSALRREVVCHIVRPQLQCVHILDRADPELLQLLAGLFRPLDVPQGGRGRAGWVAQGVDAVGYNAEG